MFDLEIRDKIAVITGGSDGLGRATAKLMALNGVKVVISGRRLEYLNDVAEKLSAETGGVVKAVQSDVCVAEDCNRLVSETVNHFGGIDILVNNAGASAAASLETVTDEEWLADLNLKVLGAVRMSRNVIPIMRERGGGSIVNASISFGKTPPAGALPTSVSRAAGLNLTKSMANEFAKDNIRVNAVCIGLVKSAQWERRAAGGSVEDIYKSLESQIPLGRVGEAEDYADLVTYLCSARGSYITGTAVNLDGGMCGTV